MFAILLVLVAAKSNKKRHAAAPPPAGVRRRMERNRQKLVGRDKGSLREQQTKGTGTTTIQMRRKTQQEPHDPESRSPGPDRCPHSRDASEFPPCRTPHRNPAWRHMVWNTRLCLARCGQPPPPGCAPSWSLVKINPVLAKPRTEGNSWYFVGGYVLVGKLDIALCVPSLN